MMQLTGSISRASRLWPTKPAVLDGDKSFTYPQFADRVARLAGALQALGLPREGRVAILAHSSHRYLETVYASLWAGGIAVPVSTRYALPETAFLLEDSGAEILIVADEFVAQVADLKKLVPALRHVVFAGDGPAPHGLLSYDELLRTDPAPDAGRGGDDTAILFYTGGTTGRSKGVMLTHTNMYVNAMNALAHTGVNDTLVGLHAGPLYHCAAGSRMFTNTVLGATHVTIPRFSVKAVLEAIQRYRITMVSMVPTMMTMVLNEPSLDSYDLSSLQIISYGGAPMPAATLEALLKRLPHVRFAQAYGMTELSPACTYLEPRHHSLDPVGRRRLASGGKAAYGCDVRVVDSEGRDVPRGTIGEIIASGPIVMKGYWKQPELTAQAIRGGYMHTGDMGYMDEDGFVFLVDRLKDMIVSGGENVYSVEVENALLQLPAIRECAVIGIPHEHWGEAVHAEVILKDGQHATPEEIMAHCRTLIAAFKCPRSIAFRDSFPLSAANKILKSELRKPFWEGRERAVN